MTQIPTETLTCWESASRYEWLLTNGIGAYASASVAGANTRRYHGLLVPAFEPPLGRAVLFSKLEEEVRVEDELYLLSSNKYPSVVQPQGFRHLSYFSSQPAPIFTYIFHDQTVVLEKQIWMAHGKNTVYIRYHLVKAPEPIRLGLVPLMAYKDYHSEQHRWDGFQGLTTLEPDGRLRFCAYEAAHPIFFYLSPHLAFTDHPGWFYNFEHPREQERGLDFTEDLYCPGRWDGTLAAGDAVTLVATVERDPPVDPEEAWHNELARQENLLHKAPLASGLDPARDALILAADQFVIEKTERVARATIIAGYPWFTDWGRDTMISLPGLCLSTGRFEVAKEILHSFAQAVKDGLLPNRFTDGGEGAEYNTVDASLWYFHAVYCYALASEDWDFAVQEMRPVLEDILTHHISGTLYNIHQDPKDGLLTAGEPGVQLTWMDAKVGDWVVTPRMGKPVEINALWHNAFCIAADLARRAGDAENAAKHHDQAARIKASFLDAFWNPATHSCFDVIGLDGRPDPSVRPNQIFAVSLPFPVLEGERARGVVEAVSQALLTPWGLRTLAAGSPGFQSHYGPGDQATRDAAYHEGTVWPWLLGAFAEAHWKVYQDKPKARALLNTLITEGMSIYGVSSLPEIFDAEDPYHPNGCIAQAWSVAEALRVLTLLSQ
jgi:predicted glycogen debranching enzyme